jgi:ribosomal-protein-alanine N-acetyltransferase
MIAADLAQRHAQSGMNLRPWSQKEYQDLIDDPKTIMLHDNFGFAIGTIVLDEAELLLIITQESHRGQGHGLRMLSEFESTAYARGAKSILLEVSDKNTLARRLYDAAGYVIIGKRSRYYKTLDGSLEDANILRKTL